MVLCRNLKEEKKMAIERVRAYFREYGMEGRVRELDESSATVELAAAALNCEPQRIAKDALFHGGRPRSTCGGCRGREN